jgi:hypothetical protein
MAGGAALTWWERRAFRPPRARRLAFAALVLAAACG